MRIGPYRFQPRLVPTLAFLLLLPLLVALGFWQLERAAQKQAWLNDLNQGAAATPLNLNESLPPLAAARYRRAEAEGRLDTTHQFLLDNQVRQGRVGYRVFTPLRLTGGGVVLVDRGWVPAPPDRSRLPEVAVAEGVRAVTGVLYGGPSVGIRLGPSHHGDDNWPRRIQYLDFDALGAALGREVPPLVLRALDSSALVEAPRAPRPELGPERHWGYAVQWFALATALAGIFIVVNTRRVVGRQK